MSTARQGKPGETYIVESDKFVSILVCHVCWDWAVGVCTCVLSVSNTSYMSLGKRTKLWPEYGKSSLPGPFDILLSLATRFDLGWTESRGVT